MLPLAAMPVAAGFRHWPALRSVTLVLLTISTALLLPRVFEDAGRFIYNNRSGVDATLRWLSSSVDLPGALPSVHREGGSAALGQGLIWLAGFVAVAAGVTRRAFRSKGASYAFASGLMALVVMACAQLTWASERPIDSARSRLSGLDRFRPWMTTIVDVPAMQAKTIDGLLEEMAVAMRGSDLRLDSVAAGEYVVSSPSPAAAATMQVLVGRNTAPIAQPAFDDLRNPQTPFRLRLPVAVRMLNFRLQPAVDADVTLRPIGVVAPVNHQAAIRAARYGHARAFFFDERLYPERDGFWTRANASSTVVIDTDQGTRLSGLPISVVAGAAPTTVSLSIGEWSESLSLAAGQKQELMLPSSDDGVWPLRIRSGAGFRPSEREPGNRDVRELAAWIAIH
jgi:hypothetical protein